MATTVNSSYTAAHEAAVTRVQRANGNPYLILDVPQRTTDHAVLKTAKRKGALQLHPDKNRHPGAADAMKQFNEAFEKLMALPAGQVWQPDPVRVPAQQPSTRPKPSTPASAPRSTGFAHEDFYQRSKENFQRWHYERQRQQQQQSAHSQAYGTYYKAGAHPFEQFFQSGKPGTSARTGTQRQRSQYDFFTTAGAHASSSRARKVPKKSAKTQNRYRSEDYAAEEVEEDDDYDDDDDEDVEYAGFKPSASSQSSTQPPCDNCHKSYPTGIWPHPILQQLRLCRECFKLPRFATVTRDQAIATYGLSEEDIQMFAENLAPNASPVAAWARNATTLHGHPMIRIYLREHIVKVQKAKLEAQQERHERFKKRQEESDRRRRERQFAAEANAQGSSGSPRTSAETERARLRREADARAALLERARHAEEKRKAEAEQEMADRMQREHGFNPSQAGFRASQAEPQPPKQERSQRAPKSEQHSYRAKQEGHRSANHAVPSQAEQARSSRAQKSAQEARSQIDAILEEVLRAQATAAAAGAAAAAVAEEPSPQGGWRSAFRPTQGSAHRHGQSSHSTQRAAQSDIDQINEWLQQHMEQQQNRVPDSDVDDDDVVLDHEATRRGQQERHKRQKRMPPDERRKATFSQLREELKQAREADATAAALAEAAAAAEHVRNHSSGARNGNGAYRTPFVVSDDSDMEVDEDMGLGAGGPASADTPAEVPHQQPAPRNNLHRSFAHQAHGRSAFTRQQQDRSASVVTISDSEEEVEERDELLDDSNGGFSVPNPPDSHEVDDRSGNSAPATERREAPARHSVDEDDFEITSVVYSGGSSTPPRQEAAQAGGLESMSRQSGVDDSREHPATKEADYEATESKTAVVDEMPGPSRTVGTDAEEKASNISPAGAAEDADQRRGEQGPDGEPEVAPLENKPAVDGSGPSTRPETPRKHRISVGLEAPETNASGKGSKRQRTQGRSAANPERIAGHPRARSIGETSASAQRRSKMARAQSIPLTTSTKSAGKKKMKDKAGVSTPRDDHPQGDSGTGVPRLHTETDNEQTQDEKSVQELLQAVDRSATGRAKEAKAHPAPKAAGSRRSRTSQGESAGTSDSGTMPSPAKRPKQRASSEIPFDSKRQTRSQVRNRGERRTGRSIPADTTNLAMDGLNISPKRNAATALDAVFAQGLQIDHRPPAFRPTMSARVRLGSHSPSFARSRLGQAPKMAGSSPLRHATGNLAQRAPFPTAHEVIGEPSDSAVEDVEMQDV